MDNFEWYKKIITKLTATPFLQYCNVLYYSYTLTDTDNHNLDIDREYYTPFRNNLLGILKNIVKHTNNEVTRNGRFCLVKNVILVISVKFSTSY